MSIYMSDMDRGNLLLFMDLSTHKDTQIFFMFYFVMTSNCKFANLLISVKFAYIIQAPLDVFPRFGVL